ncbi:nucleotidyltransferase domain-containing protein [Aquiflexum sp. TKW24L]|uniref:nucleotidyltransferase domain-containing protein n=1 Tax=Aquiflexum sp. TKW24L TaxID=2942212 RepID=UPI0020BDD155|nr:nucleotidyltransferase domain-containing protein [Aquiflexum sp. TKW24L]MCL6258054.1 nucleotidyltransferase domain-containing protein [Aquiflexum sp. TKW24L]
MVDQRVIDTAKRYVMIIPKNLGVKKAFLFGSFAKGKEREESDIDIALVLENMPDFFSTQRHLMKLRRKIDLRIEPHPIKEQDFNSLNPFAQEVVQTGIEITIENPSI